MFAEPTVADAYTELRFPVLIVRGQHAPTPTRLIAEFLYSLMPNARLAVVSGAGHMGPLTHAADVNTLIGEHVAQTTRPAPRTRFVMAAQPAGA